MRKTSEIVNGILGIGAQLKAATIQRDEEIAAILPFILAKANILLLGPTGTGKSMLASLLTKSIRDANIKKVTLSQFTEPAILFGAIDVEQMTKGKYVRVKAGSMRDCHLFLGEEITRASHAIRNTMLPLINEGEYIENGHIEYIPMWSAIFTANSITEEGQQGAFYDRIDCKLLLNYIASCYMEQLMKQNDNPQMEQLVSVEEIEYLQKKVVPFVTITQETYDAFCKITNALVDAKIPISDRKARRVKNVIRAVAVLDNRNETCVKDLSIMKHMCWEDPREIKAVRKAVGICEREKSSILEILDAAKDVYESTIEATDANDDEVTSKVTSEGNNKLKKLGKKLAKISTKNDTELILLKAKVSKEIISLNQKLLVAGFDLDPTAF